MNTSKNYVREKFEEVESLKLNCFSFLQNQMIPPRYTSDGININPALYIEYLPEGTESLAVIVEDPDVPHDSFCHWIAWNIPVTHQIKEKENRGLFGINDFGNHGYNGPHPFSLTHRYYFKVYALDCVLELAVNSGRAELEEAMDDHIIGFGMVTGKYKRQSSIHRNVSIVKSESMLSEELKMLFNEKGKTCVSVLLPLYDLPTERQANELHLARVVKEASALIRANCIDEAPGLIEGLEKLKHEISFTQKDEGIGLYVSDSINFYTTFPFTVSEKIHVDKRFQLREVLRKEQYSAPYTVLYIDEKEIRLYHGKLNQLIEAKSEGFPMFFEEEYEYQRNSLKPPVGNAPHIRSFENDQIVSYTQQKTLLDRADEYLHHYLQNSEVLVLCGMRSYISAFVNHSVHAGNIVSVLYGNYNRFSESDFSAMVWPTIKAFVDEKTIDELNEFNEKIGEGMTEEGIVDVWEAIAAGRGETLLVENNFQVKGFVEDQNSWQLHLHPSRHLCTELQDAVNDLLDTALNQNCRIVFLEDGMLKRNQQIALVTRF